MNLSIFCPFCQRKNSPGSTQCAYCGVQFVADAVESFTTKQIAGVEAVKAESQPRCAELLAALSPQDMALFVFDEKEPILLKDLHQIVLGRNVQHTSLPVIDLTSYGGNEMGVSRQHAQISHANGLFTLTDLGSTNGTWLNKRQLAPSKPYRLQPNDLILLGQLRISVCFRTGDAPTEVLFTIRDSRAATSERLKLTPRYVATKISPLLQAVTEIQKIIDECRLASTTEIYINALSSAKREPVITVNLDGANESILLIQKWIVPWRRAHKSQLNEATQEQNSLLQKRLAKLTAKVFADITQETSEVDFASVRSRLQTAISIVAKSQLELLQDPPSPI